MVVGSKKFRTGFRSDLGFYRGLPVDIDDSRSRLEVPTHENSDNPLPT